MKQMGVKLDLSNDVAVFDGDKVKLMCTSTGHCLPMTNV